MSLIIVAAVVAVFLLLVFTDYQRSKKAIDKYLSTSYGKPRENIEERYERIGNAARLFLHDCDDIGETDIVDDITWDDLGMDDIFITADHTDSFAVWNGNRFLIIRSRFEEYLISCLSERGGRI